MKRSVGLFILACGVVFAGCGGGGGGGSTGGEYGIEEPPEGGYRGVTTLTRSIALAGSRYSKMTYAAPWPMIVRQDLAQAQSGRSKRRTALASFVQVTDIHIMDTQSPARPQYLQKYINEPIIGSQFLDIHRPQEALGAYVTEAMVQAINSLPGGPVTGAPFACVVSTGDNGDFRQKNELKNYIALLDGSQVITDTSGEGYMGVQDTYVSPDDPSIYEVYYHPDPPPAGADPDNYKTQHGYPDFPGMLTDATKNFTATGLKVPWYSGFGNHDGEQYGTIPMSPSFFNWLSLLGSGQVPGNPNAMILDLPKNMSLIEFLAIFGLGDVSGLNKMLDEAPKRTVPANPDRVLYTSHEFIQMHLDSPPSPGPVGHGFAQSNIANNQWYYTFNLAPDVLGIMLDTVDQGGGVSGSIGDRQLQWMEQQIQAVSSVYYDNSGTKVTTSNPNKLVVLFSHHNLQTMGNFIPDPYDPIRHLSAKIIATLQKYPNVILWVNGHSHFNRVWSHPDESGQTGGFWEVNTASHIDYPQQSRTVEIVDNKDGTLSIFGVLIDHASLPETVNQGPYSMLNLASISRELAANDPAKNISVQLGTLADRNVELVINKPF